MARILIVDDEQEIVTLIQFTLEQHGHQVSACLSGKQALAVLGIDPPNETAPLPDLILMDLNMNGLDGATACARLAATPRTRPVPIILLTGDAGASLKAAQNAPNCVGRLDKPFLPSALRALIDQKLPPAPEVRRA